MHDLHLFRLILTLVGALRPRGSWTGETHLQKVGYFLQELMLLPSNAGHILYKHGPYSFDLRRALATMRVYQYVDLQPKPYPYGPTLVEGRLAANLKRFTQEPEKYRPLSISSSQARRVPTVVGLPAGVAGLSKASVACCQLSFSWKLMAH